MTAQLPSPAATTDQWRGVRTPNPRASTEAARSANTSNGVRFRCVRPLFVTAPAATSIPTFEAASYVDFARYRPMYSSRPPKRTNAARDPATVDRGWYPAVDGRLQEDFANLVTRDTVADRALDVRSQLVPPIRNRHHREVEHAPGLQRQAVTTPHGAPTPTRSPNPARVPKSRRRFRRPAVRRLCRVLLSGFLGLVVGVLAHALPPFVGSSQLSCCK